MDSSLCTLKINRDLRCERIIVLEGNLTKIKLIDNGSSIDKELLVNFEKYLPKDKLYIPPETSNGIFEQESLIWSVGMIFCFILSGKFPFDGPNDRRVKEMQELELDQLKWSSVSLKVQILIKRMLQKDLSKRIKLEELDQVLSKLEQELLSND